MQDSVSHLRQLRQFIHQTNLCADFFEDCKELERRLHGIKSYLFYRYPQRIVIIDYLQAFDDNDFAENLAIHLVNRVANKTLDVATEEKKLTQQLKELHKFLATLQAVHCELTEYLWAQQVQTIFVKKPNVIQANHLKELKIMSDKHTPESLRSLWLNVMDRFTFSQEARFIRSTYLIHSLVLKLLTRSMGIYLLQQFVKATQKNSIIIKKSEFQVGIVPAALSRFKPKVPSKGLCCHTRYSLSFPISDAYHYLKAENFSFYSAPDGVDLGLLVLKVSFAHELLHLIHLGENNASTSIQMSPKAITRWANYEEFTTIEGGKLSENSFAQRDYGLLSRMTHFGASLTSARERFLPFCDSL